MMPKCSPVKCTTLTLEQPVPENRKVQKTPSKGGPVWSRPNTLRRLSQKAFLQLQSARKGLVTHIPFLRVLGPFYSSEVLPPFLAEQASQTCRASLTDLLSKPLRLARQASHACRTSFLKRDGQVWAFVLTGGPCERMGPTFFGRVDMGILDSPMGPLGLPGLSSQFTLFSCNCR